MGADREWGAHTGRSHDRKTDWVRRRRAERERFWRSGSDTVWVIDTLQGTLTRVDPETLEAEDPIQLGGSLDAIEAGAGAVWILDKGAGIVTPIDPADGNVGSAIRVGADPIDIAAGLDALWVANLEDGTISRIDAGTRLVETIQIGSPVAAIAVDESTRSLWIVIAIRP